MEEKAEERPILELKGPHGRFSLQALLMGDDGEAAYAVIAAESGGFRGSSSFHLASVSLASFVKDLDRLRRGETARAVFELSQYPDCKVVVEPAQRAEFASIHGVIGSMAGMGPDVSYRWAVRFGFYFERAQLARLSELAWSRGFVG